jgi:hypothetical protein
MEEVLMLHVGSAITVIISPHLENVWLMVRFTRAIPASVAHALPTKVIF